MSEQETANDFEAMEHKEKIGEEETIDEHVVDLPMGIELSSKDIYSISASEKAQFFVIIGATGSGKTTLVTSIYHLFLSGKYTDKFLFAGSKTLAAFEKRAFGLRTSSKLSHIEMKRTQRGSVDSILHLRIKALPTEKTINLLFSDFSGEDFESVSANTDAAVEDLQIIRAASHLVFLLDGEKIASKKYRHSELQQLIHMLRTFLAAQLIRDSARILVAISKYDLITKRNDETLNPFIETILDEIISQIPDLGGRCIIQYIASMPDDTEVLPALYGLEELLESLIKPKAPQFSNYVAPCLTSQFNMWKERHI